MFIICSGKKKKKKNRTKATSDEISLDYWMRFFNLWLEIFLYSMAGKRSGGTSHRLSFDSDNVCSSNQGSILVTWFVMSVRTHSIKKMKYSTSYFHVCI